MNILEITLQHRRDGVWPAVLERRRSGDLTQRSEGELGLHEDFDTELRKLALSRDVFAYGTYLGEALFQGKARSSFDRARASAEDAGQPLRLLLVVEDPAL